MAEPSRTSTQLAVDRQHNTDVILAESALYGEQFIAVLRIAMFFVWGVSMKAGARLSGFATPVDGIRSAIILAYILWSLAALLGVRKNWKAVSEGRTRASVRHAIYWPIAMTFLDFALVCAMQWRNHAVGHYYPSGFVAGSAFYLAFSLLRFSPVHVVQSTVLAMVSFLVMDLWVIGRDTEVLETVFILSSYLGLGVLIGFTQRRIGEMFVKFRIRDNLTRFLPRQVAERVMRNEGMLKPSQREVTVLFTDIRDFTMMTEKMPPGEVLAFLDEYFGHMSQIVKGHDGIVNKFLGDGMLAVWGAPDTDPEHAEKALRAALDMRKKLIEFNADRAKAGHPPIRMGIGVHTGIVAAGMLGGADQHEYTVIGDAVNLASRIESLTKTLGVDLLVSESTWSQLKQPRHDCARAGEEKVKGRAEPVVVYTVPTPG